LEAIRQEHPDDLQCDKTYLTGVDAGEETSTTRFIAIPVTLNQGIWGHIVMIVIDRENHTLEFYDPKGLSIRDLDGIPLRCSKREDIGALVKRLITRHRISRIVENTEKQQADNDSCGVYVSHFLAKRLEFPDKTTIFERPSISIYQMRLGLINAIFQRCALV
jgi:Ulp1 family protease